MKNFRKQNMSSISEISTLLRGEDAERADFFDKTIEKIEDKKSVVDFWNLLVEYKKHDKFFGVAGVKNADGLTGDLTYVLAYWLSWAGGLVMYKATDASEFEYLGITGILGASSIALLNKFYHLPKAEQAQNLLEAMRVREPELYDVERCFNKTEMLDAEKTGDVGKKAYQEAHKVWLTELKESGIDLTKGDIQWNALGTAIRSEYIHKEFEDLFEK